MSLVVTSYNKFFSSWFQSSLLKCICSLCIYYEVGYSSDLGVFGGCIFKWAFNDYVDKKRWAAGPKFPVVQVQGEKCPP